MTDISIKKTTASKSVKMVIMCCDAPLHFYLIHQLQLHFPISGIVVEPDKNQMNWLWKKGRYKLWWYRLYHSKRKKWLGRTAFTKKYFDVDIALENMPVPVKYVTNINHSTTVEFLNTINPDITIVCGTMFIGKKVRIAGNCVINLHGGILPEYKGNQCIFFALHEKNYDKIGATIHLITGELDGGAIIQLVKPAITATDYDEILYAKSLKACIDQLIEILHRYYAGEEIIAKTQPISEKKIYSHCDRTILVELRHYFGRIKGDIDPTTLHHGMD